MNEPNETPGGGGTAEFFRQVMVQLSALWRKLSFQQKLITASLVAITLVGLLGLLFYGGGGGGGKGSGGASGGMRPLYSDLDIETASQVEEQLKKGGYKYKLENGGRNIFVSQKQHSEIRLALAREGMPRPRGVGNEIFDRINAMTTDATQRQNIRRALEGELQRTIEDMDEVKSARVHLVLPEGSVFISQRRDAKASVSIRFKPGRELSKEQVRAITNFVASSVDGLRSQNISIVDAATLELKSRPQEDESVTMSDNNRELQQNVEKHLMRKINEILTTVLGYSKSTVQVTANLDFDQVEKTIETFDPESRVLRSEGTVEENTKNAPDGDRTREEATKNYEMDKTVQRVVQERGYVRTLSISVAVDGKYERGADGKEVFVERTQADMQKIEELVKSAVGYDLARGDKIFVTPIQFENEALRLEKEAEEREKQAEQRNLYIKLGLAALIGIIVLLLIRSIAKAVTEAMNPPTPDLTQLELEDMIEEEEPSEADARASAMLEKVELLTAQAPVNIAAIIKQWLVEDVADKKKK